MNSFMEYDFNVNKIELACLVEAGKGASIHKNRPSYGLALFLGGDRTFYFDDKKLRAADKTIVYFPKGSNYTIKEKILSDCYAINFQLADEVSFEPFAFKIKSIDSYLESFKSSQRLWEKKKPGYNARVKSELYSIIYNMQSEFCIPYSNSSVIQPAIDYIHSNYYKESISISYLAAICNITTVHLSNCFTKQFGISPVKYISRLKMKRAQELLLSQLYSVKECCYLSGYNDESYFSREFKKRFKCSPSEYQKSSRN